MKSYVVYARKSTESDDRQALSIQSQLGELKSYAAKNGIDVDRVFSESMSAKRSGRPVFLRMIQYLRNSDASGILCWKLDRLTRNMADGALINDLLDERVIQEIVTPSQVFRNTATDKFMSGLDFLVARKYLDDLSENVKRGLRTKTSSGWMPGRAPLGYLNVAERQTGLNVIVPDPDRFTVLQRMWHMMLSGTYSIASIVNIANERWGFRTRATARYGGVPLTVSLLHQVFHNIFYTGRFVYHGEEFEGKHQPMVTRDQFNHVQVILGRNGTTRPKSYEFAYRGLIQCGECGRTVTPERKYKKIVSTGIRREYVYYRCSSRRNTGCHQRHVRETELNKQILEFLATLHVPDPITQWLRKYIPVMLEDERNQAKEHDVRIRRKMATIDRQLQNLLDFRLSQGNHNGQLLTDEEFIAAKNRFMSERSRLSDSLSTTEVGHDKVVEVVSSSLCFVSGAKDRFSSGSDNDRRMILAASSSHRVLKDGKLLITAKSPLDELVTLRNLLESKHAVLPPGFSTANATQTGSSGTAFCPNLGGLDDVRTSLHELVKGLIRDSDRSSSPFKPSEGTSLL